MRGEFVDVGGTRVYYYAAGSRGAGEPVLFLHGFPTSSRLWHAVVRDFPEGYRLVVADLPGYGRSDPIRAATVGATAETMLGLLDDLRIERVCLVGHGRGGGVAQALALLAPSRVTRVALVSTEGPGAAMRRIAGLARAALPFRRAMPAGFLAGLVQGSALRGFADRERSRLTLDTCLQPFTTAVGAEVLAGHLRAFRTAPPADLTARFAALGIPTAILWGARDRFLPPSLGARLHTAIPGSTLEIVDDAAHYVPEDAPERVIAVVSALLRR